MKYNAANFDGWTNTESGYGIVSLEYSTALIRAGVDVSREWERQEHINVDSFDKLTDEQRKFILKPFKKEKIGIIKTTPELFFKCTNEFRIGYSMVENTRIGEKWTKWCNDMDMIFVPSAYLIDVFRESGVTKPIVNVKQGIDSRKFPYVDRKPQKKFIFGTVGYQDDRKNWQDLVRAFCSEFDGNESVELWIKNTNGYWIAKEFNDERVRIINRMYSFEEVQKLYTYFDCFVFPSHAEGSGLPPREAMATGIPCIITNWSGLTEISDPSFSYPLTPISIDLPDIRGIEQPGFMAKIDITELMYWMRWAYEHPKEVRLKGKMASEFIHKNYNWDECARDMLTKLEAI
jgi:glycosyltransferase involved in cell wall biosynthesis